MMVDSVQTGGAGNELHGAVNGAAVQAGAVHGGVHIHHAPPVGVSGGVPRQVPAPPARFVGRDAELALMDRVMTGQSDRFRLLLVTGPGGVGKSALVAQWAARARSAFRDGQLYADLAAADPAGPSAPGELLGGFLRALGLPYDQVPARAGQQAALFRSLTAGKRLLVVLDSAASAGQVRPLLPGGDGCMVVVTARSRLGGLVADGAQYVALQPLPATEATALLRATIGDHRVDADPDAATALVGHCAGLPIALAVTAARLAVHPHWPIRRVVGELASERDRLDSMSTSDGVSVAATLDLSYRALSEPAARCYRALGLHPGRRPSGAVVAAALDMSPARASSGLEELVDVSLVDDAPDERYQMHDLALLHAQRHARSDRDREVLTGRIAEWYLAGTRAADVLLTPYRRRPPDQFFHLDPAAVTFRDRDEALDWLERERTNLVAIVVAAAEAMPALAWRIAYGMWPLFKYRRHHHDRLTVDRVAVDCARRLGNRDFEARMVRRLAFAYLDLNQWSEAGQMFQASLDLSQELDDAHGVAAAVEGLGMVALGDHQLTRAGELFTRQEALCRELGEDRRAALATVNLGVVNRAAGQPAQAVRHLTQAIAILASSGTTDPYNAARARLELGRALIDAGRYAIAREELRSARGEMDRLGSPRGVAQAHHSLAVLAMATGRYGDAHAHLGQAIAIFERLGDPDAAEARKLALEIPPTDADPDRVT